MPAMKPETELRWGERAHEARRLVEQLLKHMDVTQLAARLRTKEKVIYRWATGDVAPRPGALVRLRNLAAAMGEKRA